MSSMILNLYMKENNDVLMILNETSRETIIKWWHWMKEQGIQWGNAYNLTTFNDIDFNDIEWSIIESNNKFMILNERSGNPMMYYI